MSFSEDTLYAAVTDGTFYGAALFTESLGLLGQVGIDGPLTGIAGGSGGTFYGGAGNTLTRYDDAGTALGSISGSATTTLPALSFADGTTYVAVTDGSFYGVAMFTETLGLIGQIGLPGPITGLAAGASGTFYTAAGNTIRHYDSSGVLLQFDFRQRDDHPACLELLRAGGRARTQPGARARVALARPHRASGRGRHPP